MDSIPRRVCTPALLMMMLLWIAPAQAYVGPGAGLSLLGALWGLLVAVVAAVGFILFWPIRRMFRASRANATVEATEREPTPTPTPTPTRPTRPSDS